MKFLILTSAILLSTSSPVMAYANDIAYPSSINYYTEDESRIDKTYVLYDEKSFHNISLEDFKYNGKLYTLSDITQTVNQQSQSKVQMEDVTTNHKTNKEETLITEIPETLEIETIDGYKGILYLDKATIKSVASTYGSSTKTYDITRTYNHLSQADTSYIDKTIYENNRTYSLDDVSWTYNGNSYSATAYYKASVSSSYVKTYDVSYSYIGEVIKEIPDEIIYTTIYTGEKIFLLESGNFVLLTLGISGATFILLFSRICYISIIKKRRKKSNEDK